MSRRLPPRSFVDVLAENLQQKTKIRVVVVRVPYQKERFKKRTDDPSKLTYDGVYTDYKYRISAGPEGMEFTSGEMNISQIKTTLAFMCDFANLSEGLARGLLQPAAPAPAQGHHDQ